MSKQIKLTPEELENVKALQSQKIKLNEELAAITSAEFDLAKRKENAKVYYESLRSIENSTLRELQEKYGLNTFNLNLETGEVANPLVKTQP